MTSPTFISSPHTHLESSATHYAHPGKVRRIRCPVHGGTDRNVSLGNGWAKCHSRGCASKDILVALGERPALRYTPPPMPPRPAVSIAPLPPVSHTAASDYLAGIGTPEGAEVRYQRYDGQSGKHWRNLDRRRNPGVTGDGWQVRRFDPADAAAAPAIALAEGEKDAAILALAGLVSFCAPRGAGSLPAADLTELVELAKSTGLPVLLAGDNDNAGHEAMLRVRESLRKAGLNPIDTMIHAPPKGSVADLSAVELAVLVGRLIEPHSSRWQKPARNHSKYADFRCLRPKHWQGRAGDYGTTKNLRSCENTAVCQRCEAWAEYLHIERAIRGEPAQLIDVSGFGGGGATIPETVGLAKVWRGRCEDRIRKSSAVNQKEQNNPSGGRRNFLTALRIRDDYRAGLAILFSLPMSGKELSRERARAEQAGLTFTVIDHPSRADIEAIAPQSLSISMGGQGMTAHTHTWTTSGWPDWEDNPPTYAFSDGRYLEDNEAYEAGAITTAQWKKDNHQGWDNTLSLRANLERREGHALHNSLLWVSACTGLNPEILQAIGNAASAEEVRALVLEVGDYEGPIALLRDTAKYLKTGKGWRSAYGPVLDVAGIGGRAW